jgi:hypothetical protein
MNIDLISWQIIRSILQGLEDSEASALGRSRSIPQDIIPKFISEIDKELKFNGS